MREYREVRDKTEGDREAAAPYLGYARAVLGGMKAEMQLGGLEQLSRTRRTHDGAIVTVSSVFGQDTIAISVPARHPSKTAEHITENASREHAAAYVPDEAVPQPAGVSDIAVPQLIPDVDLPVHAQPEEVEMPDQAPQDDQEPAQGEEFVPPHPNKADAPTEEPVLGTEAPLPQEERFDEVITQYSIWLRLASGADSPITVHSIAEWSAANGFTGRKITLTGGYVRASVIYLGYVWWADLGFAGAPDTFHRAKLSTGATEVLFTREQGEGDHAIVSTVTPAGVMFAVGRLNASILMFAPDGALTYNVPAGFIGLRSSMFVNDGNSAYLGWIEFSEGGGINIYDVRTGVKQSTIAIPDNSRRYIGQCITGALAGGSLYGLQSRRVDGTDTSEFAEVYASKPANAARAVIGAADEYYPGQTVSEVHSSAVSISLNGTPVVLTAWDLCVVDKKTNSISKTRLAGMYGLHNSDYADNVASGASVIPHKRNVMFVHYANDARWRTSPPVHSLLTYNLDTGEAGRYVIENLVGYLVQYKVIPPINPRVTDLPYMPEWAYLSHTTVNPEYNTL